MRLSREKIQRMVNVGGNGRKAVGGSQTDISMMLAGYATQEWTHRNYLSIEFFNRLFTAHNGNEADSPVVSPNDMETTITAIESMFGFWTQEYISALGTGSGGSGAGIIHPVYEEGITATSTFSKGDAIAINGTIYRCIGDDINRMPLGVVVQNGVPVYDEYKGHRAWVVGDNTVQDGWEVWLNSGLDFYIANYGDRISQAERDIINLYSLIGQGGGGGGTGGGIDPTAMWSLLGSSTSEQIAASHISDALTGYATQQWVRSQGYLTQHQSLAGYATEAWVSANFNNYSLPLASSTTRGGVKTGYTSSGKNYAVQLDSNEKMYVNVPWTDTNTWRPVVDNLTSTATDQSLSANQGRLLNNKFANYLPLTGGTITGDLTVNGVLAATSRVKIGDIYIGYDTANDALEIYKLDPTDQTTHIAGSLYAIGGIAALGYGPSGGGGGGTALNPVDESTITASTVFHADDIIAIDGTVYRCIATTGNLPVVPVMQGNRILYNERNGQRAYVIHSRTLQSGWEIWLNSGLSYHIDTLYLTTSRNERAIMELQQSLQGGGDLATQQWVRSQGYLTQHQSLAGYATQSWVRSQGYLTQHQSLAGYATEAWVSANFNNYSLPLASSTTRGGVKTGYTASGKNYAVQLDSSEKMYVNVPWTDTNTWRPVVDNLTSTATDQSLSANQGRLLANGSARDNTKVAKAGDTMTGTLNIATGLGISDATGNGMLVYKPSGWTGVSNQQWGVGATDIVGVIRSSNAALQHYRYAQGNYDIIDSYGGQSINNSLQVASVIIQNTNEINAAGGNTLYLQYRNSGHLSLAMNGKNVGIGSNSPSYKLHVVGQIYTTIGVYSAGDVSALSDERHKRIEGRVNLNVEQIAQMPDVLFTWTDRDDPRQYAGTIAQSWQQLLPQVVRTANDQQRTLSMDYSVAALMSVIATARRVCNHESRIRTLEAENASLRKQLETLIKAS